MPWEAKLKLEPSMTKQEISNMEYETLIWQSSAVFSLHCLRNRRDTKPKRKTWDVIQAFKEANKTCVLCSPFTHTLPLLHYWDKKRDIQLFVPTQNKTAA